MAVSAYGTFCTAANNYSLTLSCLGPAASCHAFSSLSVVNCTRVGPKLFCTNGVGCGSATFSNDFSIRFPHNSHVGTSSDTYTISGVPHYTTSSTITVNASNSSSKTTREIDPRGGIVAAIEHQFGKALSPSTSSGDVTQGLVNSFVDAYNQFANGGLSEQAIDELESQVLTGIVSSIGGSGVSIVSDLKNCDYEGATKDTVMAFEDSIISDTAAALAPETFGASLLIGVVGHVIAGAATDKLFSIVHQQSGGEKGGSPSCSSATPTGPSKTPMSTSATTHSSTTPSGTPGSGGNLLPDYSFESSVSGTYLLSGGAEFVNGGACQGNVSISIPTGGSVELNPNLGWSHTFPANKPSTLQLAYKITNWAKVNEDHPADCIAQYYVVASSGAPPSWAYYDFPKGDEGRWLIQGSITTTNEVTYGTGLKITFHCPGTQMRFNVDQLQLYGPEGAPASSCPNQKESTNPNLPG